jgi:hypothetical protein
MLSLVHVMGYRMAVRAVIDDDDAAPIDREMVIVPELWVEQAPPNEEYPALLRETLDVVWQSAGWERSPYFTPEGAWKPRA